MTTTTEKLRSLFLVALMVGSVFGATVAFSGGAAAAVTNVNETSSGPYAPGDTVTVSVTNSSGATSVSVWIDANDNGVYDSGEANNVNNSPASGGTTVSVAVPNDAANGDYDVEAVENTTLSAGSTTGENNTSITVFDTDYTYDKVLTDNDTVFQGQILLVSGLTENHELRQIDTSGDTAEVGTLVRQINPDPNNNATIDSGDQATGQYVITNQSRGTQLDNARSADAQLKEFESLTQTLDVSFDDDSRDNSGPDTTTDLIVESNRGTTPELAVTSPSFDYDDNELDDIFSDNFNVDETTIDGEDYFVLRNVGGASETEVDFTDIEAGQYNFTFEVLNVDEEAIADDTASIEVVEPGDGDASFSQGSYTEQKGDMVEITANFNDAATSGTILIGDIEDDGYQLNVSVNDVGDNGQVTLYFNTFAAGNTDTINTSAQRDVGGDYQAEELIQLAESSDDADVEIDSVEEHPDSQNIGDILAATDYSLSVGVGDAEETAESPDGVSTLFLEERATGETNTWVISDNNADDIDELGEVPTAIEDEELTQASTVAKTDTVVHQVQASGLTGMLEAYQGYDVESDDGVVTNAFINTINTSEDDIAYEFTVEQSDAAANADGLELNLSSTATQNAMTVFLDPSEDTFYVMLDISAADFERGLDGNARAIPDETEFESEMLVKSAYLLDETRADYGNNEWESQVQQSSTATYLIEDADASFDEDPYTVAPSSGQTVMGTTNLAPGSEMTVRADSEDEVQPRFVKTSNDVVVSTDGTFSVDFDFTEQAVGDTFTLSARNGGTVLDDVDGEVTDAPDTTTTTAEPTETTAEPTETTAEPTTAEPTTSEPTETTSSSSPGFGIAIAVVALLAAALLAYRRD
jgi:PGF-CTERM protein/surface glycoprotein (TIGR04207 family)